jgi:hypothetical protein
MATDRAKVLMPAVAVDSDVAKWGGLSTGNA